MKGSRLVKYILAFFFIPFGYLKKHHNSIIGFYYLNQIKKRGKNCVIEGGGDLYIPSKVKLGKEVYIGKNFFLHGGGGLSIGSYTHVSRNVSIHTRNHNFEGEMLPYDKGFSYKCVEIGEYCWIGMNVCITPGVKIGSGCIIGMGSVISKDVPDNAIVTGANQVFRRNRDVDRAEKLKLEKKFLKNYE